MVNVATLIPAIAVTSAAVMSVMAEEATPFRFEDYKERTAFNEAVTTRFPVGSSYVEFKKQVIAAGAKAQQDMNDNPSLIHVFKKSERAGVWSMIRTDWTIGVAVEGDTIKDISTTLNFTGHTESNL